MKLSLVLVLSIVFVVVVAQQCSPGYYFNGQRCDPCLPNCLCKQEYTCDSCLPGYTFDSSFKNCLPCPAQTSLVNVGCTECCSKVVGTSFVCSNCSKTAYTFLLGGQCIFSDGCLQITKNGICESCASGYYSSRGKCGRCDVSCSVCMSSTYCRSCASGYWNSTNANGALCTVCSAGCTSCSLIGACEACGSRYRLNGAVCTPCSSQCLQCTVSGCDTCETGYVPVAGVCQTCNSQLSGCLQCSKLSGTVKCDKCSSIYYLINNNCQPCASTFPNSALCTAEKPLQCANDLILPYSSRFYLVGKTCVQNINKCKNMSDATGKCASCYFDSTNGYYKLKSDQSCQLCNVVGCQTYDSTCQCLTCLDAFQFFNGQCLTCQNANCKNCQAGTNTCQNCINGFGRISSACIACTKSNCLNCDGDFNVCQKCYKGYYLSEGSCFACQSSCQNCSSNTVCYECNSNYYLTSFGRCKSLPSNCVKVYANSTEKAYCKKCSYGYRQTAGSCYPCSSDLYNLGACENFCPSFFSEKMSGTHFDRIVTIISAIIAFAIFTIS